MKKQIGKTRKTVEEEAKKEARAKRKLKQAEAKRQGIINKAKEKAKEAQRVADADAKAKAKKQKEAEAKAKQEAKEAKELRAIEEANKQARELADEEQALLSKGADVVIATFFEASEAMGKESRTATLTMKLAWKNPEEIGQPLVQEANEKLATLGGNALKRFKTEIRATQRLFNKKEIQDELLGEDRDSRVYFGMGKKPMLNNGLIEESQVNQYLFCEIPVDPEPEKELEDLSEIIGDWIEKMREEIPCTNPNEVQIEFLRETFKNSIDTIKAEQERFKL
jgi:hypothetical protein